ncbi:dna polymerase iv kappa [Stylonychia lemnae]|uniref:DNA polymerase kappa n=1 Tax=Stylonychia lemnae TaxID=5949 RepID=A0A078AAS9_STYLE|nr:dna polymerase iv kappa [Stylonychia lemnae]|eukprot:CDW79370.1 dna polymerase iv kappa [Stylonychia lemnae]
MNSKITQESNQNALNSEANESCFESFDFIEERDDNFETEMNQDNYQYNQQYMEEHDNEEQYEQDNQESEQDQENEEQDDLQGMIDEYMHNQESNDDIMDDEQQRGHMDDKAKNELIFQNLRSSSSSHSSNQQRTSSGYLAGEKDENDSQNETQPSSGEYKDKRQSNQSRQSLDHGSELNQINPEDYQDNCCQLDQDYQQINDTQMNQVNDDRIDIIAEEANEQLMQKKYGQAAIIKNPVQKITLPPDSGKKAGPESMYYLSIHKAGLEEVDKDMIHKVIQEASKTSEFYKQEEKKLNEVKERCKRYQEKVDQELLKKERNLKRTWIHVDMDAFYAAVEMKEDPSLAEKPIAVGEKNMIMTTNYIARKFGVRSGVPSFIGKRLCPELMIIKPNFPKYRKASEQFKSVLLRYDENLESIGLDEVNMDVTDYLIKNKFDNQEGRIFVAQKIRREIFEKTSMTASCGIACNKMLAKICSDMNKPDGQTYLHNDEKQITEFMNKLPVRKLVGVGKVNEQILLGMGIQTCEDVMTKSIDIYINFTENAFDFLVKSAMGIARNTHDETGLKKSLNVSQTFQVLSEYNQIKQKLEELCEEMEARAKQEKLSGRTLTLEFKNDKFKNKQRSYTQNQFIWRKEDLMKIAINLLNDVQPLEPTRQISVKLLNLRNDKGQLSASATEVNQITGGRTKLGGTPKENQPKALKATVVTSSGDGGFQKITKQFWVDRYKYKTYLNNKFNKMDQAKKAADQGANNENESILKTKTSGVFIPYRKGFIKKWTPVNYNNLRNNSYNKDNNNSNNNQYQNNHNQSSGSGTSNGQSIVQHKDSEKPEQPYKEKYRGNWMMNKTKFPKQSYYNNSNNNNSNNSSSNNNNTNGGQSSGSKSASEYSELKAYKNFYKNNKLYISKYKKLSEQNHLRGQPTNGGNNGAPQNGNQNNNGASGSKKGGQSDLNNFIKCN